jgi:hypothetical protein
MKISSEKYYQKTYGLSKTVSIHILDLIIHILDLIIHIVLTVFVVFL